MPCLISKEIQNLRKQTGLSQVAFVEKYNKAVPLELTMTSSDLCKYENGVNEMPLKKFCKMQEVVKEKT